MGVEYYLVKPNQKEIFYLGKHFRCPEGIVNRNYKDKANYIDYDCWEDFLWDFIRENSFYFEDLTLESIKEAVYRVYEWCLDDKVYFDHDCNDSREWTDWKETGSLSDIMVEVESSKKKEEVDNIKASLEEFQSVVFENPSYETALFLFDGNEEKAKILMELLKGAPSEVPTKFDVEMDFSEPTCKYCDKGECWFFMPDSRLKCCHNKKECQFYEKE